MATDFPFFSFFLFFALVGICALFSEGLRAQKKRKNGRNFAKIVIKFWRTAKRACYSQIDEKHLAIKHLRPRVPINPAKFTVLTKHGKQRKKESKCGQSDQTAVMHNKTLSNRNTFKVAEIFALIGTLKMSSFR